MNPKEPLNERQQMAEMHDAVIQRIDKAYKEKRYIEVCWLCYACFENRVNRVLVKICSGCPKTKRKDSRHVGITTKIECYIRLIKSGYPPVKDEDYEMLNTVKGWCSERNDLIHGMISLDLYNDADKKFANLAKRGRTLVKRMYAFGTDVREYYYNTNDIPAFDFTVSSHCRLKYKCIREE